MWFWNRLFFNVYNLDYKFLFCFFLPSNFTLEDVIVFGRSCTKKFCFWCCIMHISVPMHEKILISDCCSVVAFPPLISIELDLGYWKSKEMEKGKIKLSETHRIMEIKSKFCTIWKDWVCTYRTLKITAIETDSLGG